jgi:hypothetical protein
MKTFLGLIGAVCGMAIQCHAIDDFTARALSQTNTARGKLDGVSTNAVCPATAATNYYITLPQVQNYGDLIVTFGCKQLSGSATDNCKCVIDGSDDGVIFNRPSLAVITVAASGTTFVLGGTNIVINSMGAVRVAYVTNGCATIMTNITVKAVYKPKRFGP